MTGLKKRDPLTQQSHESTTGAPPNKNPDSPLLVGGGKGSTHGASGDWRALAQRIQHETDSSVIVDLVQQLIAKLDEEKSRKLGRQQK